MGAHQCEGELSRGSSRPSPSSRRPIAQPGPPAASDSSERQRHKRVALSLSPVSFSSFFLSPVCAWIYTQHLSSDHFNELLSLRVKGHAQSHPWVWTGWIWNLIDGWMLLAGLFPGQKSCQYSLMTKQRKKWAHVVALTKLWLLDVTGSSNSF